MVCGLTLSKEGEATAREQVENTLGDAERLRRELTALAEEDARAYAAVMEAYKRPKGSAGEKKERSAAIQQALEGAARVPLQVMEGAVEVLELLPDLLQIGLASAASDVAVAGYMAQAAQRGAAANVRTNLGSLKDQELAGELEGQLVSLEGRAENLMRALEDDLAQRL